MDPVSVFKALYDTKCLKFGRYELKSGLVAPYYMNLRRLPLYPALMDAIVTQVYERFLSPNAVAIAMSQVRRRRAVRSMSTGSQVMESIRKELIEVRETTAKSKLVNKSNNNQVLAAAASDSDSQMGDDETSSDDWEEVTGIECHQYPIISGVPYGAIPLAAAIAHKAKLPFLFERKEAKVHGDHQPLLEDFNDETCRLGGMETNDLGALVNSEGQRQHPVVLIEDVICSGESILQAAERLERQNLKVEFVICIIDREENGTNLLLQRAGIRVLSLYKISAIMRLLEATGRITREQFVEIRQWISKNQFRTIGVNPALIVTPEEVTPSTSDQTQAILPVQVVTN